MLKKIVILLLFLFVFVDYSIAETDVVYPTVQNSSTNADSTFLFGNTDKGSDFYINFQKVPLFEDNFFVYNFPLKYGKNEIVFTSILNGVRNDKTYIVTRKTPSSYTGCAAKVDYFETPLVAETINDNSVIREKPSSSSRRIGELPKNVTVYLSAKSLDYYKLNISGESMWIHKSNLSMPINKGCQKYSYLKKRIHYFDSEFEYFKYRLTYPVPFKIVQVENSLVLYLYNAKDADTEDSEVFVQTHNFDKPLLGYEGYYEGNNFILRKVRNPEIYDKKKPLKGIKIFVDAGHGGSEKGALGPTRVCEKDINLSIALKLIEMLKKDGAIVSYSRIDDSKVPLYDRVKSAKENKALISVSIHNNSLPQGKDPFIKHGTEVHYYNDNAKLLSEIINDNLASDTGLLKSGIIKSSFALNRSTCPVSVLIEAAYMINPDEYIFLKNRDNHEKIAASIEKSIKEYIMLVKK